MRRRLGLGTLALWLLALAIAGTADAATYTVFACRKPDGSAAPTAGWTTDLAGGTGTTDACATGGAMHAELVNTADHPRGARADLVFTAPQGLPIAGYVLYRHAATTAGTYPNPDGSGTSLTYHYNYDLFHDGQQTPEQCRGGCNVGQTTQPLAESNAYARGGLHLSSLRLRASCDPDFSDCKADAVGAQVQVFRAAVDLEDDASPAFTSTPAGTMLDTGRALSGVVSASFGASDAGGGVYRAIVEVDGRAVHSPIVDTNDGRCTPPFTTLVPCKPSASASLSLDTTQLFDGVHAVRILVRDATDANQIAYGPVQIETRNGTVDRGAANGTNASDGARLTAAFRGRRSRDVTVAYRRRVRITGRLRAPDGRAIAGARLDVVGIPRSLGAAETAIGKVTTSVDGSYAITVRAAPSRRIQVRYRAFANDRGFGASAELVLRSRAALTLGVARRAVRPGADVTFAGRLKGRPIPAGGVIVELQVLDPHRGWTPVKTLRTDRRGRFRYARFAFKLASTRGTFRFRAVVRRSSDYPYEFGRSRTVALRAI